MDSSDQNLMEVQVFADEFLVGGKEGNRPGWSYQNKKINVVCAGEITEENKMKRMYGMQIGDYSSASLKPLFERHIQVSQVTTDDWKGYRL